jgi:hypothetical protein
MSQQVILLSKRFEVSEKARKIVSLEAIIGQFERSAQELAQEIASEETRTRIHDPLNVLYSTLAKSTAQRRANLLKSVAEMRAKLVLACQEHEKARGELAALEQTALLDANQFRKSAEQSSVEARTN